MKTIPLSKGMNAIVDDDDSDAVSAFAWCLHSRGYAVRKGPRDSSGKRAVILMHRSILSATPGTEVDHINGNRLDNRRSNLRFATSSQNHANQKLSSKNTTGAKGVSFNRKSGRYYAEIHLNHRKKFLGSFSSIASASAAYDAAARLYFGDFARTNATLNQVEAA